MFWMNILIFYRHLVKKCNISDGGERIPRREERISHGGERILDHHERNFKKLNIIHDQANGFIRDSGFKWSYDSF